MALGNRLTVAGFPAIRGEPIATPLISRWMPPGEAQPRKTGTIRPTAP